MTFSMLKKNTHTCVRGLKFEVNSTEVDVISVRMTLFKEYRTRLAEVGSILGRALKEIRRKWSF